MIYVFDTSALRELRHFYPTIFRSIWSGLDELVSQGRLKSTREVLREIELQNSSEHVKEWCKVNSDIFTIPSVEEQQFVRNIFAVPHFRGLIGKQQQLKGMPVADPFIIACAAVWNGVVVTQEGNVPNAAKIPNVCDHFQIKCIKIEEFMQEQRWNF